MNKLEKAKKVRKIVIRMVFVTLAFAFFWWLYTTYSKIEIHQNVSKTYDNNTTVERTSLTIEEMEQESKTVSDVIEDANKAVVGISKIKNVGASVFTNDSTASLGIGTGFIVSENGYIITNEHVSGEKYSNCYVTLESGKIYNGNVVWSDSNLDLSIVKINMKGLDYMKLGDSNDIRIGEAVYAIGNPVGFEFQRTVTSGIISAVDRTIKFAENGQDVYMADLIQTDAGINPGNSGGPLIKPNGTVIAINSIKITSAEGIGFAVPINVIKPVVEKFIANGNFEEATLGIFAYDKNVIPYLNNNMNFDTGIYVVQIVNNSSSQQAGLQEGDVLTKIDGIELNKMNDLKAYIYTKNPNDEVTLTVVRNRETLEIKVKLGKK